MNNYRYMLYVTVLAVLGYGLLSFQNPDKIIPALHQIGWHGFAFVCALSLVNYSLRYVRWMVLLKLLGDRLPVRDGFVCYLSGFAMTITPGKAGETIRSVYFKERHNVNHTHTFAAILSERTSDAIASFILATLALYNFVAYRWIGAVLLLLLAAVVSLIFQKQVLIAVSEWFRFVRIGIVQRMLDALPVFVERASGLFSWKALGIGTLVAIASWSAEGYGFAWLACTLGGTEPVAVYISIFAIGMIAGAISFLPGGLGGAEAVLYFLLSATGMGEAESVAVTLLCRLATLWFAVILGVVSLTWLEHNPPATQARQY